MINTPSQKINYLITDNTDILMSAILGTSQQNIGMAFNANIPLNAFITLKSISGRFLNSVTAGTHNYAIGLRISGVNYWFNQMNNNGVMNINANATVIQTNGIANNYLETNGTLVGATSMIVVDCIIDAVAASIPTGLQSIQLITAYATTAGTIKGTLKQTRILLAIES